MDKRHNVNASEIPAKLKSFPQWVTYQSKELVKGEKPTKIPINPITGKYAKTNVPQTWGTFEEALKYFNSNGKKTNGTGFVVSNSDPFTGIDLDHCRDPQTGIIEPWALSIVKPLDSYTEITPSGTGLRIFVEGKLPEKGRKKGDIEAYCSTHFLTVTGNHLEGTPTTIEARQPELDSFYHKYFSNGKPQKENVRLGAQTKPTSLTDQETIEKALQSKNGDKFRKLLEGDFSDYPSWSEADLAFCSMLAFWTGNNQEQMNCIFRQSGLMRDKWDEKHGDLTYGEMTINKAIEGTTEIYRPSPNKAIENLKSVPMGTVSPTSESQTRPLTHLEPVGKKSSIELKLTTIAEVFKYPDLTYLIEDMIVEGTLNAIGGYTGTGKSVVVLDLMKSVVTHKPFLGKYPVNKTGAVLLVDEETPRPLLRDRIQKMKFDPSWPVYFLHFQDIKVDKESVFNALMEKIKEVNPILVVFDSLIRIHRKREKESEEMAQVIDALRKIANWGTTVLIIHHHKKGGGPLTEKLRGSSDIPGGIDVEFALTPEKEGDNILLFQSVKSRIKPFPPIRLKLNITEDMAAVEYYGTQNETILEVIVDVLSGVSDFLTVKDINQKLIDKNFDGFKEYEIRKALREGGRLGVLVSSETKMGKSKAITYKVR